jgi:hypothetical protein
MTDHEHLERAYRRLLAWYPRKFRHENEQGSSRCCWGATASPAAWPRMRT